MTDIAYSYDPYSNPGISDDATQLNMLFNNLREKIRSNSRLENIYADLGNVYLDAGIEDWDGHGAAPADANSYHLAKEFLSQLPAKIPAPEITVDPDGEISFEWYKSKRHLIILSVSGDSMINYVGVIGKNRAKGVEVFDRKIPDRIMELFKRVYN